MSMIGRLAVAVLGDISNLKESFGEAKKEARGLKRDLKSIDGELRAISRSMVMMGTVVVGSMTAMVLKSTQAANAADKLAKQTGLTREQVQELGYAADQEHASLEELAKSIARLSRAMLTSTQGTNEQSRAFDILGINVKDANGNLRSSVDVLLDIADRFKDMTNETEMTAVAMQLLGRSGANLVPFLRMGGDEIRKLTQEARDLGYVMDEETVKALKALDDQLTATKAGFAGIGRQIASEVVPGYLKLADAAVDFFKWLNQTTPELRSAITQITALGGVMALLSGSVFLLYLNLKKAAVAAAALNIAFKPFLIGGAILAGLGAIGVAFMNIRNNARLAKTEVQDLADAELDREEQRLRKELEVRRRELEESKRIRQETQSAGMGKFAALRQYGHIRPNTDIMEEEIKLLEERLDKLIKEREAREKAAQAAADQAQQDAEVADILEKMKNELDAVVPLAEIFGTQNEVAAQKASILENAIRSLIGKGVDPAKTSMGDLVAMFREYNEEAEKAAKDERLKQYYEDFREELEHLITTEKTLASLRGEVISQEQILTQQLQAHEALMKKYIAEGVDRTSDAFRQLAEEIRNTSAELKRLQQNREAMDWARDFLKQYNQIQREWQAGMSFTGAAGVERAIAESLGEPFDEIQAQIDATIQAIQNLMQMQDENGNPIFTVSSPAIQQHLETLRKLRRQQKSELELMFDDWSDWGKGLENITRTLAEGLAKTFSDFFFDPLKADLTDFLNAIRRAFADMLGQRMAADFFSAFNIPIPGRATGGPVTAGVVYRINEREPEFFRPHQSGEVVPLSKMGMTADVDVIIQNQTGVPVKAEKQSVTVEGERVVARLLLKAISSNTEGIGDILGVRR